MPANRDLGKRREFDTKKDSSWATSGENFDVSTHTVFLTPSLNAFFQSENRFFLVAAKGMGKTILLKKKRQQIQQRGGTLETSKGVLILPQDKELDYVTVPPSMSQNWRSILQSAGPWNRLWQMAIVISIVLNMPGRLMPASSLSWLSRLTGAVGFPTGLGQKLSLRVNRPDAERAASDTPSQVLSELLSMEVSHFRALEAEILPDLNSFYVDHVRNGVCVFIDSFDQSLAEVDAFAGDGEIWVNGQIGLLNACWQLNRHNHHIKVFTSIRQEAYARFSGEDRMAMQSSITVLRYKHDELMAIFDTLIRNYEAKPSFRELCGIDQIENLVTSNREDIFDYVYRHTLGKPREFAVIGNCLHDEGVWAERDVARRTSEIRRIVNRVTSDEINQSYLGGEMARFLDVLAMEANRQEFFRLLPYNILNADDLTHILAQFRKRVPSALASANPFEELFNLGLLGYVALDHLRGGHCQGFRRPDQYSYHKIELPTSSHYFVHPALGIHAPRSLYHHGLIQNVVVGDLSPWGPEQFEVVRKNEVDVFLSYSSYDRAWVDSFEEDLFAAFHTIGYRVSLWRDVWRMRAGRWVQDQIEEAIRNSDVLISVVSERSLSSDFVESEWRTMMRRELKNRTGRVIPISRNHINKDMIPEFLANKYIANLDRRRAKRYSEQMKHLATTIVEAVRALRAGMEPTSVP